VQNPGPADQGNRKAGPLWEEGDSKADGLTIDQIVVSKRTQAYTPSGLSLYAKWLLLGANFAEFVFYDVRE
jgi:hypothetical protein